MVKHGRLVRKDFNILLLNTLSFSSRNVHDSLLFWCGSHVSLEAMVDNIFFYEME